MGDCGEIVVQQLRALYIAFLVYISNGTVADMVCIHASDGGLVVNVLVVFGDECVDSIW